MRFSSDLDAGTLEQLAVGRSLMYVLRQAPNQPVAVHKQVAVLFAGTEKALVKVPDSRLREAVKDLYDAVDTYENGKAYAARFASSPVMDDELKGLLTRVIEDSVRKYRKG